MRRDDLKILTLLTRQFAHLCSCASAIELAQHLLEDEKTRGEFQIGYSLNGQHWRNLTPKPEDGAKVMNLSADTLNEFKKLLADRLREVNKRISAFKVPKLEGSENGE